MRNTFSILFYVKRNAPLRNGEVPVMGRITIDGERAHLSTRLSVPPALWEAGAARAAGRTAVARRVNERLVCIRNRIERCYETLFAREPRVTARMVKELYFGAGRPETLLAFFGAHNDEFGRMVGLNRSKTTYYKYRCVHAHLGDFIRAKYRRADLSFREIDRAFVVGFHAYIAHECACRKNTVWIYMIALKHVLMLARSRGYLRDDPFAGYRLRGEPVSRNYLTDDELQRMIRLDIAHPTLRLVRDAYLFGCFTGLSYVDLLALTPRNLLRDGRHAWISTARRKTGTEVHVRLFALSGEILARYLPEEKEVPIFALPSNGWCNLLLLRIASMAGIAKRITFHSARHTFATTVALAHGMKIETISKLLGHSNIRTTQIYAEVTRPRLDGELERLGGRLDALYRCRAADDARPMPARSRRRIARPFSGHGGPAAPDAIPRKPRKTPSYES